MIPASLNAALTAAMASVQASHTRLRVGFSIQKWSSNSIAESPKRFRTARGSRTELAASRL
jgi:hypothetical protein